MMIRKATVEDAYDIARIHVHTWRDAYTGIVPQSHLDNLSVEKRQEQWNRILRESPTGTIVATDAKSAVIGWASFGLSRDDDGAGIGELYAIYLQSDSWGKGYGRQLMDSAETSLSSEGFPAITLWVLEENVRTRRFYQIAGYFTDQNEKTIVIDGMELNELRYRKLVQQSGAADG